MDFITVKDAAKILGVAHNTVRSWADSGKLKSHRHPLNGYRLFRKSDCERLVDRIFNGGGKR